MYIVIKFQSKLSIFAIFNYTNILESIMYSPGIERNVSRVKRISEGIYMANWAAAASKDELFKSGITHIVSATPLENVWGKEFEYLLLVECPTGDFDDCPNIENAYIFAENALRFGGRVCYISDTAISRSSIFLLSFLMKYKCLSLLSSLELLRNNYNSQKRPGSSGGRKRMAVRAVVWPQGPIMDKLIGYESKLHSEGVLNSQVPLFYSWGQ